MNQEQYIKAMIGKINIAVKESHWIIGDCFKTGCHYVAMANMEHDM